MKNENLQKIKKYIKKNPILEKYVRIIFGGTREIIKLGYKRSVKGHGNIFKTDKSSTLFACKIDIVGNNNRIEIGQSAILRDVIFYIRGNNNYIRIGKSVRFSRGGSLWVEDHNNKILIGANTTVEDAHIAVTESNKEIVIGEDCMIAYDVDLRTGDSHSIINTLSNKRLNYAQSINIGDHVWIASHVSILKGVKIAKDSVVATRAVVTKSFEEGNILIGGIPACELKENISWDRHRL